LWGHLQTAIDEAIGRGVAIRFVVRAGEKTQVGQLKWLREHRIKVDLVERLHAKIYLNEKTVLVSSMNITETSTTNSRDFAMIVESEAAARKLRNYVDYLTGNINASQSAYSVRKLMGKTGTCIRDGRKMDFNPGMPLCYKCYPKWAKYKNKDYEEKFCHSCGRHSETTYARPLCPDCDKKLD
jgi:phosphatidylserine/phosphatidylglycerophosphate/cardiolipin synthase-like enzyme